MKRGGWWHKLLSTFIVTGLLGLPGCGEDVRKTELTQLPTDWRGDQWKRDVEQTKETEPKPAETSAPAPTITEAPEPPLYEESKIASSETIPEDLTEGEHEPANLKTYALSAPQIPYQENTPAMQDLDKVFRAFLEEQGLSDAKVSLVYQDLRTGERYSYNPDERYLSASCIKVGIAMTCAKLVDAGAFFWDMPVANVADPEQYVTDGDQGNWPEMTTLGALVEPMLRYSNNTAASILFRYCLDHGRYLHALMDDAVGTHYAADTTMSAREGAQLMLQLCLNPEKVSGYSYVLDQLRQSSWNEFCTARLPKDIVANKYGEIYDYTHEIGAVFTQRPFVYSVFAQGANGHAWLPALGELLYRWNVEHTGGN